MFFKKGLAHAALMVPASGGAGGSHTGPINVASINLGSLTSTASKTFTTAAAIPAGAAVVVAFLMHGNPPASFADATGQTWVAETNRASSALNVTIYKCIATGAGIPSGTTFTVTWTFINNQTTGAITIDYFTGFSSLPSTNNGGASGSGTQQTVTVTGPTVATSYQFFVSTFTNAGPIGPDSGSTAGWTHWITQNSNDYAMNTYYIANTSTSSTTIKVSPTSFAGYAYSYIELAV